MSATFRRCLTRLSCRVPYGKIRFASLFFLGETRVSGRSASLSSLGQTLRFGKTRFRRGAAPREKRPVLRLPLSLTFYHAPICMLTEGLSLPRTLPTLFESSEAIARFSHHFFRVVRRLEFEKTRVFRGRAETSKTRSCRK